MLGSNAHNYKFADCIHHLRLVNTLFQPQQCACTCVGATFHSTHPPQHHQHAHPTTRVQQTYIHPGFLTLRGMRHSTLLPNIYTPTHVLKLHPYIMVTPLPLLPMLSQRFCPCPRNMSTHLAATLHPFVPLIAVGGS